MSSRFRESPWASSDEERLLTEAGVRRLVGDSLAAVSYLVPAGGTLDDPYVHDGFDEASSGVELAMSSGAVFVATWRMDRYQEGLWLRARVASAEFDARYRRIDVSSTPSWEALIGATVEDIGVGWHVPNEDCPQAVWAVRLQLKPAATLLIALGWSDIDGGIEYMPDEVVVVFDEQRARAYYHSLEADTLSPWR